MTVHVFVSEKTYNYSFLKFYESNFSLKEQIFVIRSRANLDLNYSDNLRKHILYIENSIKFVVLLVPLLLKSKKIYIHYLPIGPSLYIWFILKSVMKKTIWILWGSDLYYFQYRPKGIQSYIYELLRKKIIKNVSEIACFIKGDYELAKEVYKTNASYRYFVYPIEVDFEYLDRLGKEFNKKGKTILVGNSGASTNNHLQILLDLKKFKNENITVICPLSYVGEKEYVNQIVQVGKKLFGSRFIPLLDFLPSTEYSKILSNVDIGIFNHDRQQGLGNILMLLYLGAKVFIKKEVTSFSTLSNLGLIFEDTNLIYNMNYKELINFNDELKIKNKQIVKNYFSKENYIKIWSKFFN